jgi:hypothetical protein
MNLLRTDRELARVLQVFTDVLLGLGRLADVDTRDAEAGTGCLGRTVNADNRVTLGGDRTSDTADGNILDV